MCAATVKMQTFLHPISCIPLEGGSLVFQPHPPPLPAPFVDNGLFGPRPPEAQSRPASRAWLDVLFHFTAKRTNQNAVRTFIHICRNRKPRCGIIVEIIDLYILKYIFFNRRYMNHRIHRTFSKLELFLLRVIQRRTSTFKSITPTKTKQKAHKATKILIHRTYFTDIYRYKESGYYTFHYKKKQKKKRERKCSYREIYFLTCLRQTMNKRQQTPASGQPGESLPNPKHVPFLLILSATK